MYTTRDGILKRAVITEVDVSVQPPQYGLTFVEREAGEQAGSAHDCVILFTIGGRLRPVPARLACRQGGSTPVPQMDYDILSGCE
jgi:hypothetical protein